MLNNLISRWIFAKIGDETDSCYSPETTTAAYPTTAMPGEILFHDFRIYFLNQKYIRTLFQSLVKQRGIRLLSLGKLANHCVLILIVPPGILR